MIKSREEMAKELGIVLGTPRISTIKESTPTPPKENIVYSNDAISKKREELELRRLELELEKLAKPDTSIDYYSKMLELQEKNFNKQMEMIQAQSNLKLEIEKLKILQEQGSGDFASDFLYELMPLLPQLIAQNKNKKEEVKGGEIKTDMSTFMNAKEQEEYKLKIKCGVITEEMAYNDFCTNMPQFKDKITREQFSTEFNKIKNG